MLNRCRNCGSLLNYDISSGKLKCESCDSLFEPDENKVNTDAEENQENADLKMSIFTCPNCGGEVASNELEAVEYCLYCGSFVTLDSQVRKIKKPDYILPFSKTKEECKKSFTKMMRRKLYAPKDFKDEEFLEGFKGIYVPYWTYDFQFGPNVKLQGVEEERHGDYIHKQYYNINSKAEGEIDGISFDASSSFDDEISSRIAPFDPAKLKDFNESYMYGFFADTADTTASLYQDDADEIARDEIWKRLSKNPEIKKKNPERPGKEGEFDDRVNLQRSSFLSMIPIWFLTWRKGDRVAYSVMNGDNGEIYSEVPVDTKKYILWSLIMAVPIFLLLNAFITFSAMNMLKISLGLSVLMILAYYYQLEKIIRRMFHTDDKGYLEKHKDAKKKAENTGTNWISDIFELIKDLCKGVTFWGIVFVALLILSVGEYVVIGAVILALVIIVYTFYRIFKNMKILNDRSILWDLMGSFVSLALSIVMILCDPAGDEFYYFAAIACIAGVGLTAIFTMRRYNELVTRPLPHFFDRKAGGKS